MFRDRFDLVFSIGGNCACAMFLNETKLRMASSPFDWLSSAPFEERIDTLCSRFRGFLVRENIAWHSPGQGDRASDVYMDTVHGYRFVHDFPKNTPLDESFPRVRAKYDRRIARLLKRLDDGARACLVWWSLDMHPSDEACRAGIERVREAFPNSDCKLIVFENDKSFGLGKTAEHPLSEHCLKIRGAIAPDGCSVLGDRDLNVGMYRRIRIGGRLAAERRRFVVLRALARLLSLWHLDRESRKRAREAWEARLWRKGGAESVGW